MPRNTVSAMLREGLYTRVVGRRIVYFQRISSTMDEAARLAQEEAAEDGTVVLAEEQTAGRGRFQRTWVSESGNLLLSVLLKPSLEALPYVSIMAGVAVARAIRKTTGLEPAIKWPNDVRLGGRKVCGILVETSLQSEAVRYAIVGIGLNVAFDPTGVEELADIATGLNVEAGKPVDREVLLKHLLQEIDRLYLSLGPAGWPVTDASGPQRVLDEWRGLLETLGKRVEVRWRDTVYRGLAEDVDGSGNLLLCLEDGTVSSLPAGEVTSAI